MRTRSSHPISQSRVELRQGANPLPASRPGRHLAVEVGRPRWLDLFSVHTASGRISPSNPNPGKPVQHHRLAILKQLLPFSGSDTRVFVARSDGRSVGFVVFKVVGPDQRWVMDNISANLGVYAADPVVEELLHYGVVAAGLEGTKRLYSHVPTASALLPSIRRCGFAPYTTESILASPMMPAPSAATRGRRQLSSDVWSIHQLYIASVPRQVQYAEALTSHNWDLRRPGTSGTTCNGWLIEDGYQAVGYIRAESSHHAHVLEFVMHPDHRHRFPELIGSVAKDLQGRLARPAYVFVRAYQREYLSYLHEIGFSFQMEQELHVKYTTAPVRSPAGASVAFTTEVKDPVGKRVPTFLIENPSDPSSEASG